MIFITKMQIVEVDKDQLRGRLSMIDWSGHPPMCLIEGPGLGEYDGAILTWILETAVPRALNPGLGPGLILVPSLAAMHNVVEALRHALRAAGLDGEALVVGVSARGMSKVRRGKLAQHMGATATVTADAAPPAPRIAVATGVWNTGVDIPRLAWVILDASYGAPVGVVQSAGRGSRIAEGKAEYEVLIPPGRHRERQLAALRSEGYREPESVRVPSRAKDTGKSNAPVRLESRAALAPAALSRGMRHEPTPPGVPRLHPLWLLLLVLGPAVLLLLHWLCA